MLVKYEIILLINFLIITNLIDSSNSFSLFKSLFGKRIKRLYHSIPCQSVLREQAGKIEDTLQIPNDQLPYVCRRTIECPINPKTNLPMSLYLQVQSFQTGSCSIGDGITIVTIDSPIPARFCKDNVKPSPNTLFYPSGRAIIVSKSSNGGRHSINVRYACAGKSLNIPGLQAQKTTIKLIPNALPYGTTAKPFSLFDYVKPPVIGGTTAINRMYTRFPGGPLVIENMLPGLPNLELPNPANLVTQPNIGVYTLPSWFTLSGGRTLPPGFTFRLPPGQTMDPRIFETTPTIPYYTLPPWFTLPGNRTMPPGYIFTLPNGGTLPPNFFVTTTTPKVYTLPQWFTLPGGRTMPPGYTFTLPYGMVLDEGIFTTIGSNMGSEGTGPTDVTLSAESTDDQQSSGMTSGALDSSPAEGSSVGLDSSPGPDSSTAAGESSTGPESSDGPDSSPGAESSGGPDSSPGSESSPGAESSGGPDSSPGAESSGGPDSSPGPESSGGPESSAGVPTSESPESSPGEESSPSNEEASAAVEKSTGDPEETTASE